MQKDMCDLSAIPHAVNEPGMKISDCTGIQNELISGQLVSFGEKEIFPSGYSIFAPPWDTMR